MHRTRIGKRIELTQRDIAIFKLLRQYRYLRSTYIHAFVGGTSVTRFKERLGDLFHEGYLDRPGKQWEFADARHRPVVHEIGAGAVRVLRETPADNCGGRTFLSQTAHRQFLHSLMICEVLASLDLGMRPRSDLRLIGWPEVLDRAPEATRTSPSPFRIPVPSGGHLVPDGLFGIEYASGTTKSYRFFALEVDRGTMPVERSGAGQTSYLAKLARYKEVLAGSLYKTHWGLPNLLLLTVTQNSERQREIVRTALARFGESPQVLFKSVTDAELRIIATRLLSEPWDRVGLSPLAIDH